jgi:hypothetical protein
MHYNPEDPTLNNTITFVSFEFGLLIAYIMRNATSDLPLTPRHSSEADSHLASQKIPKFSIT